MLIYVFYLVITKKNEATRQFTNRCFAVPTPMFLRQMIATPLMFARDV